MRGSKYRFNPETLAYEKVERTFSWFVMRFFGYFLVVAITAAGITGLITKYYDSPEVKALKEENSQLLAQYHNLNTQLEQIESVLDEIQVRDDNIYRVVFDTDPIPASIRKAGFGGVDKYAELESFNDDEIVLNTSRKVDIVAKQAYIQAKSYEDVLNLALDKELELSATPAIMPLSNDDLAYTSSGWGYRIHPVYKVKKFHYGMDFVAPKGTPIYATGDGKVAAVLTRRIGHGKHVIIDHGYGYETLYGHMNSFNVKKGQQVKRGQIIGFVGTTGTSTAPHLHYEVHKSGQKVDPKYYFFKDLSPSEFDEMVAISSNVAVSFD